MKELMNLGIPTLTCMKPLIPIKDDEVLEIIRRSVEIGVSGVRADPLYWRDRDFFQQLQSRIILDESAGSWTDVKEGLSIFVDHRLRDGSLRRMVTTAGLPFDCDNRFESK